MEPLKLENTTYKGQYNSGLKKHPVPRILEIVRPRTTNTFCGHGPGYRRYPNS